MRFSFSRYECFNKCQYQFKLRYVDGFKTLPDFDNPDNPLVIGTAMHHGIELGVDEAIKEYLNYFPVTTTEHENETLKLINLIPKVKAILPDGGKFETPLADGNKFLGFIDWTNGSTILDFKYSNNITHYLESEQIHVYKYYAEKLLNMKIEKIGYLFIPKISIRQKNDETIEIFRQRLNAELDKVQPEIRYVTFSNRKVDKFLNVINSYDENLRNFYDKNKTRLCNWCEFQKYCEEGVNYMILPNTQRRTIGESTKKTMWIYGQPFSGKTTLADKFPNPLMLNTDGNIKYVTSPYIAIKDEVTTEGRITKVKKAWEIFKETIDELAKKQNDFKTIIVDLLEDTYEYCRLYMYDKLGITHESDDSFKAWDKVRVEYLSTIRKLTNLDYNNIILLSHEDSTKDVTKRTGDKITSIKPNINDKVANKVAGMVDVVIRAVVIDDVHKLMFKSDEVVFGGGRLQLKANEIDNDYTKLMSIYGDTKKQVVEPPKKSDTPKSLDFVTQDIKVEEVKVEAPEVVEEVKVEDEKPKARVRKIRNK